MATTPVLPGGFELPLEPRRPRLGSVDAVALEERAASLATRSIKRDSKVFALELAIRVMDLTTLEGSDTPGKVAALASKAIRPDPSDANIPSVAAICIYPNLVQSAADRVRGTSVKVASVATAFPSGQSPTDIKVAEARRVVELGADEVGMVIDRSDVFEETGRRVGMKPAGGIRNAKQAVQYLVLLHETLGLDWLTPDLFRFGASSLLNDVLMQIRKEKSGRYQSPDYFTID